MTLRLWRGFHSEELVSELRRAWSPNPADSGGSATTNVATARGDHSLLITCPPALDGSAPEHFDFLSHLAFESIEWLGDWSNANKSYVPQAGSGRVDDAVLGVFTSGTISGAPRLVLYSRKNIECSLRAIHALFDSSRVKTIFCYAQPFHTFGLLLGYMYSIIYGLTLVTPDGRYDRKAHAKRIALTDANLLTLGTPTHFYDLLSYVVTEGVAIAPSYSANVGGASVSRALWLRLRDELHIEAPSIGYGCTEASPGIAHLPPGHEPFEDHEIGFPLASLHAEIAEDGVTISGESVCTAIIDRAGLQRPNEIEIHDLVRVREDGVWICNGRADLQLNRGGEKFSLENIESSLLQALGLHAVAMAISDERLGHDLALFIQETNLQLDDSLTSIAEVLMVKHHLRLNTANVRWVPQLPMNASFKVDRQATAAMVAR